MSLINDALKRASQAHKERPAEAQVGAPLKPVQVGSISKAPLLIGAVLVVALGAAGFFAYKWWMGRKAPTAAARTITPTLGKSNTLAAVGKQAVVTNAAVAASPKPAPLPTNSAPVQVAVTAAQVPPPDVAAPAPAPAPVPAVKPAPRATPAYDPSVKFPELKVKAIFYSPRNPMALINSETVGIGDTVEGVTVTKIEARRVTVELKGQTKELSLGGQ